MNDEIGDITPCYTITLHRKSKHPAKRLWAAITDPAEIARWMDYPAQVDLRPAATIGSTSRARTTVCWTA